MIDYLDNLLRHLLMAQIDEITREVQVRFQPPDQEWQKYVSGLDGNALNVYLVDLRENRKLRSNERVRNVANGVVSEDPAPLRIDCHYLISAWSPAAVTQTIEPTVDEHALIYKVVRMLMNSKPLVARKIYEPNPLPANFPNAIADAQLPTAVLPADGFPKLSEFWGTVNCQWKPCVYVVITLPVVLDQQIVGPMVTTRITEYRITGKSETAELWIQIAGTVTDPSGDPVPKAWVRLETPAGEALQTTTTKEEKSEIGRFTFAQLKAGNYKLRVRAQGFAEKIDDINVPSSTGNYDVQLA